MLVYLAFASLYVGVTTRASRCAATTAVV
jgi:hypothetical protein